MGSSIIGSLLVCAGIESDRFEKGADKLKSKSGEVKGALGGLTGAFVPLSAGLLGGTSAVALFTAGLNRAAEAAQNADDLAAAAVRIGETAEALQELRHAGEASDVPLEKLDAGLEKLNGTLGALRTGIGDGKIRKAFDELGIPDDVLDRMTKGSDLLPILADRLVAVGNHADRVQIAKKLQIEELLPLLLEGSKGIERLRQEARDLGLVLDEDVVQHSAALNEELRIADERVAQASRRFGHEFVPTLVAIKNAAADATGALASMFAWLSNASAADDLIEQKLKNAQAARDRAAAIRSSPWSAFMTGSVSGLEAMNPEARERAARLKDAEARRIDAAIERLGLKAEREAREAAAAAAATSAHGSAFAGSGGGRSAGRAPNLTTVPMLEADPSSRKDTMAIDGKTFQERRFDEALQEATANGVGKGMNEALDANRLRISDMWRYTIEGGVSSFVYGGGKGLMQYLADVFRQRMIDRLTNGIMDVVDAALGGREGGGGLGGLIAGGARILGFASGGSGKVGGVGGIDSKLLSMRVSPGELVEVKRPDQAAAGITQIFHVHAEGAVLASSLVDEMRQIGVAAAIHGEVSGARRAQDRLMRQSRQRLGG